MVKSSTSTVPQPQIDYAVFDDLNDFEKQRKVIQLTEFEESLKSDLKDPEGLTHKILFSSTKDIIIEWALVMEQLQYLGVYNEPLESISSYIKKQIGKIDSEKLDSKDSSYRYVDQVIPDRFKQRTKPKKDVAKLLLNTSEKTELNEEQQFLLDTLKSLQTFFKGMASITGTMVPHLENPEINSDMLKYFDKYHKIAALREPVEFMMGEGSILHQMDDEQNIRESATIYQKAVAKSMEVTLSYRQMAHFFGVSPRQNQRIRNRLEEWPAKDVDTVIRKNILSYCCQNPECGMNVITGKKYSKNGDITGEVKLKSKSYPIPEKYKGTPLSPIQIALELAKK